MSKQTIWTGNTVNYESVMPLENEDGSMPLIPLLYNAERILEVKNSKLTETYSEGKDYLLQDGKLVVLKEGNIKTVKYKDYYPDECIPGKCFGRTGGGYIYFGELDAMHKLHIVVSYEHSDTWKGDVPTYQGYLLPNTIKKLKNKEQLKVLFYGDSITTGANSSKIIGQEPFFDDWCTMTVNALKEEFKYNDITLINTAVGGTVSEWGAQNAYENAASHNPDICFIAFGMNDGSGRVPVESFLSNIKKIIETVKDNTPDCGFILVATMLPNKEVANFYGLQEEYLPALNSLKGVGIAISDMTSIHKHLLKSKRYYDMSGNNVNHPNDFLARVYAEVMIATLIE